jgi:hypothetical protein
MYEAIMASLIEHTSHEPAKKRSEIETQEEQRILKEVMQLSKLEAER